MVRGARKPRLADVAARAGVSRTTASYILNGRSDEMRISAEAVARVRAAVVDLGYRPNRTARSLRTAQTRTVGLISDNVASGHFASRMLTGASAAAREADHFLLIGETDGDPLVERLLAEQMLDQGVDGIVYATLRHREVVVPPSLLQARVVLLNCVDPASGLPAVVPDEHGGGRAAADLAARAAGPVVVVGDEREQGTHAGTMRLAGLEERLDELGRAVDDVVRCDWTVPAARSALACWWSGGGPAGSLVCMNDRVAMGAYQALDGLDASIPADVAVVSFDGSELASWLTPTLTTVGLPFADLGEAAVRTLLDPDARGSGTQRLAMPVVHGGSVPTVARVTP
ncbi:LacI family DNA-binding transcriptional regulator [Nocardioides sp. CFH 31398]|uniref:LacI family DNA-binding transcriptional regulator n=1 Tax=Nocardioides sp. CFH 31398 TaxID=2919579 RepID=UPI001F05B46D|nr:LacI family DNA-binding transcriptional regulator [Nocardioides sp. CFH 31398]MCH1868124.1 LacI family DNA-binding transcriptional regulator [Nocardioides sp. CFH 31398]